MTREDAIDREYLFKVLDDFCGHDRTATITLDTLADLVYDMPPVTQKSGKWHRKYDRIVNDLFWECDKCGCGYQHEYNYCPNCGARMYEPQESETWNGIHGQITAPKGTFKKIWEDAESEE